MADDYPKYSNAGVYLTNDGNRSPCHPGAPAGGGGPGGFYQPGAETDDFDITDIPGVMRNRLNWQNGAAILEKWLRGTAYAMKPEQKSGDTKARSYPAEFRDTQLIKMAWIKSFSRGLTGYNNLLKKLDSDKAKKSLKEVVGNYRKAHTKTDRIDHPLDAVGLHSDLQFQYETVLYKTSEGLDDLYGALGVFELCAAVLKADITVSPAMLVVSRVGIYMRDTFDFNGPQYLGHWNRNGMGLVPGAAVASMTFNSEWPLPGIGFDLTLGWPINNSDFRAFRDRTGRGGDLMVFSDVEAVDVNIRISL
jgi:hypothetical protein